MRDLPAAGASLRDVVFAVRQLIAGRSNAAGEVTLTPDETTTLIVGVNLNEGTNVVEGANVNEFAQVFFFPKTASAAAELAAGTMYASISRIDTVPTVTITHASDPSDDRRFGYAILGG